MSACAGGAAPGDDGTDGTGGADAALPGQSDAGPDGGSGGFGDPCEDATQCMPNMVCYHPDPLGPGVCTNMCDGACPDGYECKTVPIGGTVEATICVAAEETLCNSCEVNADCGDSSDLCIQLTAGKFCSIDCAVDPTVCPSGFVCRNFPNIGKGIWQCFPQSGVCCIDGDGDLRGEGDGCATTDCDDTNPAVFDDAAEICDGYDNNCIGGVDVDPSDCAQADCQLGVMGYFERPADTCTGMGGCAEGSTIMCGLYTCDGGGEDGDHCAVACDGENDGKCISYAHCDASVCLEDLDNGLSCDEDSDCESAHCQNGFCCDDGDCCAVASDCPTAGVNAPVCDDSASCQGSAGMVSCIASECTVMNGTPNDSACDGSVIANQCGFYKEIACTGASNQAPPTCPTSCTSHADCDANAYCDPVSDTCKEDIGDGGACPQGVPSCKSGHCQNGFCCASGDCCADETDCPGSYSTAPTCDSPTACQGTADVAQCVSSICTTSVNVPDDSACSAGTVANTCGTYPSVSCTGAVNQDPPECPSSCATNADCDPTAYCNAGAACVPDEPNGQACEADGDCQSGHCQNGFCCASGDCCADANDCNAYDQAAVCNTEASCQGTKVEGTCTGSFQCSTTVVDDDSGCAGAISNECGTYPSISCTAMTTQPTDQAGLCPTMCTNDNQCDVSAHCTGGVCVPDQGPGGFCNTTQECGGALQCVDNVCCTSACNGTCQRCDLSGNGTCQAVADGQDPDNECGTVACSGFFHGWQGDQCLRKADVNGTCGGDNACRTTAEACTAQTQAGNVQIDCNDTCQSPNLATCTGQAAGTCTNLNLGNNTCGNGPCQVTMAKCLNGQPQACTPNMGAASTETCDDVDNDCNGTVDNGNWEDSYEGNNSCAAVKTFPQVSSNNQTSTQNQLTIWGSGDNDYFKIPMIEASDDGCRCCDFWCTDEDYRLHVTLTVPVGAGSYRICDAGGSCGGDGTCVTVSAGTSAGLTFTFDGSCDPFGNDSYDRFLHVYGVNAPAMECRPYKIDYRFESGCF